MIELLGTISASFFYNSIKLFSLNQDESMTFKNISILAVDSNRFRSENGEMNIPIANAIIEESKASIAYKPIMKAEKSIVVRTKILANLTVSKVLT